MCANATVHAADSIGLKWSRSGKSSTYCSDGETGSSSLADLIKQLKEDFKELEPYISDEDWKCLWPHKRKREKLLYDDAPNSDAGRLALVDVSNVIGTAKTSELTVNLDRVEDGYTVLNQFGLLSGGTKANVRNWADILKAIKKASGEGKTPIGVFAVNGHGPEMQSDEMVGAVQPGTGSAPMFKVGLFAATPPTAQTWDQAKRHHGPYRCWFSRHATARFMGCGTGSVADAFAGSVLRKGTAAYGTLKILHIQVGQGVNQTLPHIWFDKESKMYYKKDAADFLEKLQPYRGAQ